MKQSPTNQSREPLVTLTQEQASAVSGGLALVSKAGCCLGCASYGRQGFAVLSAEIGVA
jgi:hypothetical protein